jgi:Ca2+-binding RTX toxin-like protein
MIHLTGTGTINATGDAENNWIWGNDAANVIDGGKGIDNMMGGKGNDTYYIDNLADVVTENANEGTDTVISTVAFSSAIANVENYTFNTTAAVTFTGDSGTNMINGGSGADHLSGGGGSIDLLYGNAGNDTLTGGSGGDALNGGTGADQMIGGAGNDIYYVDNVGDVVVENANEGTNDFVDTWISLTKLWDNVENAYLQGTANLNLTGNTLDNYLAGNDGNNVIDGGTGADTMYGEKGNDTYIIDNVGDLAWESFGQGTDLVKSSVSYVLSSDIENLTLTGTGNINGTGNDLDNVIAGNDGGNILDGGAGNDTMTGGKGDDVYYVDSIADKVVEAANGGYDTVHSSVSANFANVEAVYLTGSDNINATGNASDNWLYGNDGANILDGGTGQDHMAGGKGDDTYHVDNVGDVVAENANEGNDTVISTIALTHGFANVENYTFNTAAALHFTGDTSDNIIHAGSGADTIDGGGGQNQLYGGAGNDTLTGGSDLDILDGGAGADKMSGGDGGDLYYVDNAGDQVIENANQGSDYVYSSVSLTHLFDNVEGVLLLGSGNLNATGNDLDNVVDGNSGANKLDGGLGNDDVWGAQGNDTLTGGGGNDTFHFDFLVGGNDGHDTITDFAKAGDQLSFTGVKDENNDNAITLADLFMEVTNVVDHGAGKAVDVTFAGGGEITFTGAGTGAVHGLDDLVASAASQVHVSA